MLVCQDVETNYLKISMGFKGNAYFLYQSYISIIGMWRPPPVHIYSICRDFGNQGPQQRKRKTTQRTIGQFLHGLIGDTEYYYWPLTLQSKSRDFNWINRSGFKFFMQSFKGQTWIYSIGAKPLSILFDYQGLIKTIAILKFFSVPFNSKRSASFS